MPLVMLNNNNSMCICQQSDIKWTVASTVRYKFVLVLGNSYGRRTTQGHDNMSENESTTSFVCVYAMGSMYELTINNH